MRDDARRFLRSLDTDFYDRIVHLLINPSQSDAENETDDNDDTNRRDASSLVRLFWHHGMETLIMLVGAFVQAPGAPHAYFSKCRTEDVAELASGLVRQTPPSYNRITTDVPYTIATLLRGIHAGCPWPDREETLSLFEDSLIDMISAYTDKNARLEYNSIKHGLRVSHGEFLLRIGREEIHGQRAPESAMTTVGHSKDASHFSVAKPLDNALGGDERKNFILQKATVTYSFDRMLFDLRVISMILTNIVSALQISAGVDPGSVRFVRIAEEEWWQEYRNIPRTAIRSSSFGISIDARSLKVPTAKEVLESYRTGTWAWPCSVEDSVGSASTTD